MPTFAFSEYDIGNSTIVPDQEGFLSFTVRTERGFMDQPKRTTLTASGVEDVLGGAIDWKKKIMEIKGTTKPFAEVKRKTGGTLSLTCEWRWSTKKYVITFKKGIWTAKCGEEPVAILTPLKRHPFKKDELATLNFLSDVSNEEMVFLIFALLFNDLKLPPAEKPISAKVAAGGAAGQVAGTVAGNALANCCSIQ